MANPLMGVSLRWSGEHALLYRGYREPGVEGYLPYKFFKTVNLRKYKDHEKIVNDLKVSSSKKKNL